MFRITHLCSSYFREPPELAPIDVISLLHGCQPPKPLSSSLGVSSGHKHRFTLQALDRTYTLSAESESERKHWVDQLALRIQEGKAPTSEMGHEFAVRRRDSDLCDVFVPCSFCAAERTPR